MNLFRVQVVALAVLVLTLAGCGGYGKGRLKKDQPPVAMVAVTPSSGTVPLAVTASTAGSSDPDGTIVATSINFGDGTIVNAASASHTYSAAGSFTVTTIVTDSLGLSSSATAAVTATAASSSASGGTGSGGTSDQPPVAQLAVTPTSGVAPLPVTASTSGSSDPDGTISASSIDFGDGTVVNAASASHTYSAAGTFTVTAKVTDNAGLSSTATATVTVTASSGNGGSGGTWQAPIGIPTPSFGVNEVAPTPPSPWSSAVPGYYYVDTTGTYGSCSDGNANGYPASGKARCTVPSTLGAGSYVEVHGTQNYNLYFTWSGNSSAWVANTSGPVWVRGASYSARPTLRVWGTNSSTYVIIENVNFAARNTSDNQYGLGFEQGANNHHLVLRNSEVSGGNTSNSISSNGSAIGIGDWSYNSGSNVVHDIVVDNVNVHDIGPMNPTADVDWHCVSINGMANHVWVTHSSFARCSGDSIQLEAQDGYKTNIHHIYFGKNTSTSNRQSGGWVKNAQDVIFSQNEADTFASNSGGPGTCYGGQYDHDYVWFLFNACHNSTIGFDMASSNGSADNIYMIGNRLWHIVAGGFDPYNASAFVIRSATHTYVVNNSVYDYVGGIATPANASYVTAVNNVFQYRNNSGGYEWYDEGGVTWTLSNNVFYNNGASLATTTPWSTCANCKNQNPLFVSTSTPDLHVQSGSPAIDAGILSAVYAAFQNRYGISINVDADGTARPQGSAWDMGAYEFH